MPESHAEHAPQPDLRVDPQVPLDDRVAALRDVIRNHRSVAGVSRALDAVSLDIPDRGLTVLTGRAGAGVSTVLELIACTARPDAGTVWVAGVEVTAVDRAARREHRRRAIATIHADPTRNLLVRQTAEANLTWAAKRRTGATLNRSGVDAHLQMVGLEGRSRARVGDLSAGEAQRLALACALVGEPRLIVADDPTARLDRAEATRLTNSLRDACDRGVCVVAGSADGLLLAAADRIVTLDEGRLT